MLETAIIALGAFFVVVGAVARLTRNLTFDNFPPAAAYRTLVARIAGDTPWLELATCSYCLGIWVALPFVVVAAGLLFGFAIFATLAGVFWVFCAWMTVGYLAGIIVATNWG